VCYSELHNLANAEDSFAAAVNKLTAGDNGSGHPATVTLVIARQGKDLTVAEIQSCVKLLHKLTEAGVIEKGAASTERGEKKGNLHLQCCLWLPAINRNAADVRAAFIALVYEHGEFTGTRRHVHAVVHEPGTEPNVTWRTQCGCVAFITGFHTTPCISIYDSITREVSLHHANLRTWVACRTFSLPSVPLQCWCCQRTDTS
jgi:hypothetical protein